MGGVVDLRRFAVITETVGVLQGLCPNGWWCVSFFLVSSYGFSRVKFRFVIY